MIKKALRATAWGVNIAALCTMVGIGAFHWEEAQAQEALRGITDQDRHCLQQNIYFEARNQSDLGKRAVAWVTLNRVIDERYPDTICGVVQQGKQNADGSMVRNACQFSWYCDGKSDKVTDNALEQKKWHKSEFIARSVLRQWFLDQIDPTEGADHYHADYVSPAWAAVGEQTVQIDNHLFYRVKW